LDVPSTGSPATCLSLHASGDPLTRGIARQTADVCAARPDLGGLLAGAADARTEGATTGPALDRSEDVAETRLEPAVAAATGLLLALAGPVHDTAGGPRAELESLRRTLRERRAKLEALRSRQDRVFLDPRQVVNLSGRDLLGLAARRMLCPVKARARRWGGSRR